MAISKGFFNKWTQGVDELISFLNENKTGTFLENINLISDSTEGENYPKIIFQQTLEGTGNTNQVSLITAYKPDVKPTVKYQIERDGTWRDIFATNDQSEFYRYMYDCLLCTNGLIVRQRAYNGSSYVITTPFILTVDNNNHLVVFCVNQGKTTYSVDGNYSTYSAYLVVSDQSPAVKSIVTQPAYTTNRTCLAPIAIPASNQVDLYLPHTWVASQTQLSSPGLYAVKINGVDYITNGTIYIRDTPAE
jgi:hypothetical protein